MHPTTAWYATAIASIDWQALSELVKTFAPVATATIAFAALRNWQRQDKAKREAEFLDALVEAAHAYIADLPKPVTVLQMAKIAMASHAPSWEQGAEEDIAVKGAIDFIEKDGGRVGKNLMETLALIRNSVINLRSLAAKGQVFNFPDYAKCQTAVAMLTWQFDRMEGLAAYISSTNLYWDNPEVVAGLKKVMSVSHADVQDGIQTSHVALLEFARATYKRIYR